MSLTPEQQSIIKDVKPIEGTISEIKNNYVIPLIEYERKIVEEYENNPFGKMGCIEALLCGFVLPIIIIPILVTTLIKYFNINNIQEFGIAIQAVFLLTFMEYFFFVWYKNKSFRKKHKDVVPEYVKIAENLVVPLISVLGMDIKEDEKAILAVNYKGVETLKNRLSKQEIETLGKGSKRGLSMYSGELLSFASTMSEGTKLSLTINEVISTVHVFKKRGRSKNSRKEKATIKAILSFPTNTYGMMKAGSYVFNETTQAHVVPGEKYQKVVIKKVISGLTIGYEEMANSCSDAVGTAYAMVGKR